MTAQVSDYGTFIPNITNELSIRTLKMFDIGCLFMYASFFGFIVARILARLIPFNRNNYSHTLSSRIKLGIEILLEMALIGILIYATRQIIQAIPFPFEGWMGLNPPEGFIGYKHKKLREWQNPYPVAFFIILFQDGLRAKVNLFVELNNF
jgi:hypothetical protein